MGSHRLHPGEELTVVTTAYIARVAELLDKAEAVWGDKASARQFLLGYQSLLGAAPLDLVASCGRSVGVAVCDH